MRVIHVSCSLVATLALAVATGCVFEEAEPDLSSSRHAVTEANVYSDWCGNKCTEGHDTGQCLCVKRAGAPDSDPSSWIGCYTEPCCSQPTVTCGNETSDVIWNADQIPGGSLPTGRPADPTGWRYCSRWDDYYFHCMDCMGEDPGYCYAHWCQYLDDSGCWIAPGQSTCTYYSPGGTQYPTTTQIDPGTCVRSNETGFWSSASWWSFLSGADTCSLGWQTPWDDTSGNPVVRCNDAGAGGGGGGPVSMAPGDSLAPGQPVASPSGAYVLVYQGDGNLVLYQSGGGALWHTSTYGTAPGHTAMQGDGHLVVYDAYGYPVWYSGTAGNPGAYLSVQDDGNLVIHSGSGGVLWTR